MHNLLHELACFASLGECVRIKYHHHTNIISIVRHLCISELGTLLVPTKKKISELKNLRSLILGDDTNVVSTIVSAGIRKVLKGFKVLHLFSLPGIKEFDFPIQVRSRKHLCYIIEKVLRFV